MKVPLLDLKAQYDTMKGEIEEALLRVARSQMMILGPETEKLEKTLAEYCGVRHAIGVSSGTDALLMALMALDIKPGDEVILPTYSFFATAGVVWRMNAIPVFVDSQWDSFNIDPAGIEKKITSKTKAILPVHLYGQCADMDPINAIAARHNIPVIEDAAQAIGSQYKDGRRAGAMGLIGCFSFYPSKNLGAFGDGGFVTTNDDQMGIKLRQMRNHGMEPKYYHKFVGGNFRLDAIQAAVLNVKFPRLAGWHEGRRRNAALYNSLFVENGLSVGPGITRYDGSNRVLLPKAVYAGCDAPDNHIYNQYAIRVQKRDELKAFLWDNEIGTDIYYPVPFHRQECFAELGLRDEDYPAANTFAAETLALPVYPEMTQEQIRYVVGKIKEFIG